MTTGAEPDGELPDELQDALFRALFGDPRQRDEVVRSLVAAHPDHARAIEIELQRFHDAKSSSKKIDAFGPFRVLKRLGEGAFGKVLLAEEPEPVRRRVALKVMKNLAGSRTQHLEEFQAIAALNHDHIAKCFAQGEHDGQAFLVLEYVEDAKSLSEYCKNEKLSIRRRLLLFRTACHALHHAHERRVLHLDVKPGNILVAKQEGGETLKVVDFGQARMFATDPESRSGLGTPPYSAPEQLRGEAVDRRADVHALGVCLFQLLADERPLAHLELADLPIPALLDAYATPRTPPSSRVTADKAWAATVRGDLDAIVAKATAPDPRDRYPTAQALADDVDAFLADRPVRARGDGTWYRLRKLLRRRRRLVATAATVLLAFGIALVAWLQQPPPGPTTTAFRSAGLGAHRFATIDVSPSRLLPGDVLGVSLQMHGGSRLAALSLTQHGDQPVTVQVTEPNHPEAVLGDSPKSRDLVLPLVSGRHDVFLCQLDKEAPQGDQIWREGLWVFHLDGSAKGRVVEAWLSNLRAATASGTAMSLTMALQMLRNLVDDVGRGGPVDELSPAERATLAKSFANKPTEDWPLPVFAPQVFWWTVGGK
jgi:serine/threonine protein kinase